MYEPCRASLRFFFLFAFIGHIAEERFRSILLLFIRDNKVAAPRSAARDTYLAGGKASGRRGAAIEGY